MPASSLKLDMNIPASAIPEWSEEMMVVAGKTPVEGAEGDCIWFLLLRAVKAFARMVEYERFLTRNRA